MPHDLIVRPARQELTATAAAVPALIGDAGHRATRRFLEFFTAQIPNDNTRRAYLQAVRQFSEWCTEKGLTLDTLSPMIIAAYIKLLGKQKSVPSVKQHLAAIRMLFDWLVTGHVIETNPAHSVRAPKYVVTKGKTPVLEGVQAQALIDAIDVTKIRGLRDRAIIGVMVYSFARVGAVVGMNVEDYMDQGKRCWFRLHEKGGKLHDVPAHHVAQEYMDAYLAVAGIAGQKKGPLLRTVDRRRQLTATRITPRDVHRMIKRYGRKAGVSDKICCHTFRATGITQFLLNGGTVEQAQRIAAHSSPKTTKLYDRTSDAIDLSEVERIRLV